MLTIGPLIYALGHQTHTRHTSPSCPGIYVSQHAGATPNQRIGAVWLAGAVGTNRLAQTDQAWQQGYTIETYESITLTSLLGFCMFCMAPCSSQNTPLVKHPIYSSIIPHNDQLNNRTITGLYPIHDKCLSKLIWIETAVSEWRYNGLTSTFFRPTLTIPANTTPASSPVPTIFNY